MPAGNSTAAGSSTRRTIRRWEVAGAAFIVLAGSALHFVFEWSGGFRPLASVAAVNESVWEHLKLAFWPGLAWAVLERRRLAAVPSEFWSAKGLALLVPPILIVTIFSTYTTILGTNLLALDIGTFVVAVVAGQLASAGLLLAGTKNRVVVGAGLALLALQIAAYATLTYFPPDLPLFVDARTGLRGIP